MPTDAEAEGVGFEGAFVLRRYDVRIAQGCRQNVNSEVYRARGAVAGNLLRIVRAVSCPLASAASTVPISGPA